MDLKRSTLILAIRTLALCCFLSSDSLADQLTVYTWFDYFPERFIKQFEKRSGHTIKLVYFYSDLERDTEIFNAQAGYDVIITDAHTLPSFASSDIFLKAETQKIPNLKNLDPRWSNTCSDLGVPFFWGGAGIAYRSSQVIGSIDSWRDLLFPEPALRGRIGMLNESFDLMVPALKLSGASVNTTSLAELKSAYKVLQAQKPHVLSYSSSYEALLLNLGNRSLALAEAYSGKQITYREISGDEDWEFVFPKEGTSIWMDCLSVTKRGAHSALAYEFIDFLLEAKVAAELSEAIWIATPNMAAKELLSADYLNDKSVFPSDAILEKSEVQSTQPIEIQTIRNKILLSLEDN